MNPLPKARKAVLILACLIVLAGLTLFAYFGLYNRYWSDDWCYNRDFKQMGALGALRGYVDFPGGYSSNRYSLTIFSGLLYLLGLPGTQLMTPLLILLWLGGLYWNLYNLSRLDTPLPADVLLLASAWLLYFVLYLSPQRFQILYWRAGAMPYSAALVSGLYVFALITHQMLQKKPGKVINYILIFLAFLAGGFSEIGCVLLFSATALLTVSAWLAGRQHKREWAMRSLPAASGALLSLGLAMLALILSPANARVANLKIEPSPVWLVPWLSIRAAIGFGIDSLKTLPLPHLNLVIAFAALAVYSSQAQTKPLKKGGHFQRLAVITDITFLLLTAIQAPTIYFYNAPPDPRGQSLGRFVMLAGLAFLAWEVGERIARKWTGRWLHVLALISLLAISLYTIYTFNSVYAQLPGYIQRAELWDERDAYIRAEQARGVRFLEVKMIDTAAIDTRDLMRSKDSDRSEWIYSCAAAYYGLEGMKPLAP